MEAHHLQPLNAAGQCDSTVAVLQEGGRLVGHPVAFYGSVVVVWLGPQQSEAARSDVDTLHVLGLFRSICESEHKESSIHTYVLLHACMCVSICYHSKSFVYTLC